MNKMDLFQTNFVIRFYNLQKAKLLMRGKTMQYHILGHLFMIIIFNCSNSAQLPKKYKVEKE